MTRDELLELLTVERFAPSPRPPSWETPPSNDPPLPTPWQIARAQRAHRRSQRKGRRANPTPDNTDTDTNIKEAV